MRPIRVLLVDDEEDFRQPTLRYLTRMGMTVLGVGSAAEMDAKLAEFTPDVVVLDVNMPGETGFDAVKRLRRDSTSGLVMLTARSKVDDRIFGLTQGADSYLSKPVSLHELEVVIRGLFLRLEASPMKPESGWLFDASRWTLTAPDGKTERVSAAEHGVLALLMAAPGQPVARDALFQALGRLPSGPEDRSVDLLVSKLRRKFVDSQFTIPIRSVRNVGYVFLKPAAMQADIESQAFPGP